MLLGASGSYQAHTLSVPAAWALTMSRPSFLTTRRRPLIDFFLQFVPPMLGGFVFADLMTLSRRPRPEVSTCKCRRSFSMRSGDRKKIPQLLPQPLLMM